LNRNDWLEYIGEHSDDVEDKDKMIERLKDEIVDITHPEFGSMWDTVREECAKEREACAKVADDEDDRRHGIANNISIIIRARGNE